nr:helix-turn-helix domain-containing protein [Cricetibacter osteomyelitidis]
MLDLLNSPEDIEFLAPLIVQEIYYYLLKNEQGGRLRELVSEGSHTRRIAKSTQWIEQHFAESLSIDTLADMAGMSVSGFHHHFKNITSMSPLQYQKAFRLTEAKRLIQSKQCSVTQAAFQVGYESPSQFSREYKRYFGVAPKSAVGLG